MDQVGQRLRVARDADFLADEKRTLSVAGTGDSSFLGSVSWPRLDIVASIVFISELAC